MSKQITIKDFDRAADQLFWALIGFPKKLGLESNDKDFEETKRFYLHLAVNTLRQELFGPDLGEEEPSDE